MLGTVHHIVLLEHWNVMANPSVWCDAEVQWTVQTNTKACLLVVQLLKGQMLQGICLLGVLAATN
jgi:hypothetical protein